MNVSDRRIDMATSRPTGRLAGLLARPRRGLLTGLLACVVVASVSGCGQPGAGDAEEPPSGTTTTADGGVGTGAGTGAVTAVTVRQSGGLAGVDESDTVTDDVAGAGPILAKAAALPKPSGKDLVKAPCCDFITYQVSVRYTDGTTASYVTWDGGPRRVLDVAMAVLSAAASQ